LASIRDFEEVGGRDLLEGREWGEGVEGGTMCFTSVNILLELV